MRTCFLNYEKFQLANLKEKYVSPVSCSWVGGRSEGKMEACVPLARCHAEGHYMYTFEI